MCSLVRHSDVFDLFDMQHVNFVNLPENYVMKYYFFHALSWPQLPTVAEDGQGKLVGYVLAKLEDENSPVQKPHGHVTSVAVLRQNRKLGLASKLMNLSQRAMQDVFSADFAALHVRVTNRAAYALYSKTLGYRVHDVDKEYYADKEDAFNMRNYFNKDRRKKDERDGTESAEKSSATASGVRTPESWYLKTWCMKEGRCVESQKEKQMNLRVRPSRSQAAAVATPTATAAAAAAGAPLADAAATPQAPQHAAAGSPAGGAGGTNKNRRKKR
ncbi:hypothetical protein Esti_001808 [Eimeria stiedai]